MTGRTYFLLTLSLCAAVLAPVIAMNLALGNRSLGNAATTKLASSWQQATRGVTYSPPINHNRSFKTLRLNDRAAEINAVVFGASSVMGITGTMFPDGITAYNFSQSGNSLVDSLGEAGYVRMHFAQRIKWFVIPLDWSIGFLFQREQPNRMDLSPGAALAAMQSLDVPLHRKLLDALSYPKIENLASVLRDVARAKDFDVLYRGKCAGFYYDGSTTFSAWRPIRAQDVRHRVLAASLPSSKYSQSLLSTHGAPNGIYLERVSQLNRELKQAGGGVIALLPPLIPGLEDGLAKAQHSAASLQRLKETLSAWAEKEGVVVLDAGRSERVGCQPLEFLDEHHAMRECYQKVFDRFWRDYRRGAAAGLYALQ
jgi:hypothetical protein